MDTNPTPNTAAADIKAALTDALDTFGFEPVMALTPSVRNGFMTGSDNKTGRNAVVPAAVFIDQIDQIRGEMTSTTDEVAVIVSANGRSTRICVFSIKLTAAGTDVVSTDAFDMAVAAMDATPVPADDAADNHGKALAMARIVAVELVAQMVAANR